MAFGVVIEFVKWLNITGSYYVKTNNALMLNLSADTFAGIIIAIIGANLIKTGKFDKITDNFSNQIDNIFIDKLEKRFGKINNNNKK
jgi:hypothetical protein